jgi:crossover junction endodeoxyribonuclease RusA
MITLHLPYPPTCNTFWRHIVYRGQPRTLISEAGRKYQRTVAQMALFQCAGVFPTQRLRVDVLVYPPDKRRRDLDNLGKSLLDSLTKAGVWGDDAQIDSLHFERGDVRKGGGVTVCVQEDALRTGSTPMEDGAPVVGVVRAGHITPAQFRAQAHKGANKTQRGRK